MKQEVIKRMEENRRREDYFKDIVDSVLHRKGFSKLFRQSVENNFYRLNKSEEDIIKANAKKSKNA